MDPYDRKREELTKADFEVLQEAEIIDEKTAEAIRRYQTAVRRSFPEVRKTLGAFPDVAKGEGAVEVLRRLVASNARVAELEAALRAALPELEYQSYRINDEICDFHRADAGLDDVCICDEQARRSAIVDQVRKALAAPEGEK